MKKYVLFLIIGVVIGIFVRDLLIDKPVAAKVVTVQSRNLSYQIDTTAESIDDFAQDIGVSSDAIVAPANKVINGSTIQILNEIEVTVIDGGAISSYRTKALTVDQFLTEKNIETAETDEVSPPRNQILLGGMTVNIDRIVDREVVETNPIPFKIVKVEDPGEYYGSENLVQTGSDGSIQQKLIITYENGAEISRKLLSENVLIEPVDQVISVGAKIEIEEYGRGRASWYAFRDCLCAAHPHYEFGRYVRVTNENNGKSVIVRINDRGPDQRVHPDRIIDLDAVAFSELASLGAGTFPVRVELLKKN